ncbi:MAG: hypothetical protein FJ295_02250 [Planctomycetes bacterium]|nr:hypothetical protein [Planctomycetota bacterium]
MSNGELLLLGVAVYAATISLVRLLLAHRQKVLKDLRREVAAAQRDRDRNPKERDQDSAATAPPERRSA